MKKLNNKKGFTLAELLIVVAIIAVLTAIAVPLFVSSLSKAKDATFAANQRALRGAAVVAILSAEDGTDLSYDTLFPTGKEKVYFQADVDEKGNITNLAKSTAAKETTSAEWTGKTGKTTIVVEITATELPKGVVPGVGG